jgi:large subunit ribosomal protein L17
MRHRKKLKKLGRGPAHRKAMLASLVCSFIAEKRIRTTLAKAKLARSLAEQMVTLARKGGLTVRRRVLSILRNEKHVNTLFQEIAPQFNGRQGGYTRILKLGRRASDSSEMVLLEWVDIKPPDKRKKKKSKESDTPREEK